MAKLAGIVLSVLLLSVVGFFGVGTLPAFAFHNPNLFVSAENSFSNNIFSGPMVIEVIIVDPNIMSLDEPHGEPAVTVNGAKLRMLQATDGNWYAYFADVDQAKVADATQPGLVNGKDSSTRPGKGLNFGKFCSASSGQNVLGFSTLETRGFAIPSNATIVSTGNNGVDGTAAIGTCDGGSVSAFRSSSTKEMNVVRQNKTLTHATSSVLVGQLGMRDSNYWPFIQLFDFIPTNTVTIQYFTGGTTQTTTLRFDSMEGIALSTDRSQYPQGSHVHVTLTDFQLNIDPTDEDSWTWGSNIGDNVSNKTVFYQLFNQTGRRDADGPAFDVDSNQISRNVGALGAQNLFGNLTTLMFVQNGMFTLSNNTQGALVDVIELADNKDYVLFQESGQGSKGLRTNTIAHKNLPVTFTETAPNTGRFLVTDEDLQSGIRVTSNAASGTTATIAYASIQRTITAVVDDDNDGIANNIDTLPNIPSDDFDDTALGGATTGSITSRGDQILTITDEPAPDGVRVKADTSGGSGAAIIVACGGSAIYSVGPGDDFIISCGSVTTTVSEGTVEITFVASDGFTATTSLNAGNTITFDPETVSFVASQDNSETTLISIDGIEIPVTPGDTMIDPSRATENLIDAATELGAQTSSLGQVSQILKDDNLSNNSAACGKLGAFVNQVNANKDLTQQEKDLLIQSANEIKVSIGC